MIHVTCGPLEGIIIFLLKTLPDELFSMEELCHIDLHEELKTPMMDSIPHMMGRRPWIHCTIEIMDFGFGGTWKPPGDDIVAPCTWTLAFRG